jgi:membrane protein insertase Oxa1/YidC/SpoIIIJ
MYGVWGWAFPAGLIMYWTTANAIQISQQTLMLRAGHIGPEALERRMAEQREKMAQGTPQKKGIMGWMNEKAESARQQQDVKKPPPKSGGAKQAPKKPPQNRPTPGARPPKGAKPGNQLKPKKKKPGTGGSS